METERESGYEKNYRRLVPGLKGRDFAECARRLGLREIRGGVEVDFLGKAYRVTEDGVEPLEGGPSRPNRRSLLIHYVLSEGSGEPAADFLSLEQLSGVLRGRREPGSEFLNAAIERSFAEGGRVLFARAARSLGGEPLGAHPSGGDLWLFRVLPGIRMQVVFSEADDEYPAEARVLFDSHATEYMGFECLAFLHGELGEALAEAGRALAGKAGDAE
ncbi:MAG: DUF3786 domain-containing protein [Deltaproteobacteria bacterium]|jgi:hypothetical protein|nr:DUF3786 domain-containing protein [Deltaproteobacteria bacterium]